ncbi:MAG: glycosyltransferase family 2 protein [Syntrophorhabdaceae bacterium]|nr:glycosyltransferase family 2 protein [Syntrophorhabdaceae bacterium]
MDKRELSIIIITKDTRELIEGLLESIYKDGDFLERVREIIVVDNGSKDGTEEFVRLHYPDMLYIKNLENMGFAAAVNIGVKRAGGSFILLLNSDTRLIPGSLVKMLDYMAGHGDIGMCGPLLVYPDMRPQRSIAYIPSLYLEVIPPFLLEFLFPRRYPAREIRKSSSIKKPVDVPSLIGAAILIRGEALKNLHGFDERFFFFLEETDLCVRMREMGMGVVFFPEAQVIHLQGKTVGKNWLAGRIEYNISLYKFIEKHHSRAYYVIFVIVRFLKALLVFLILSFLPFLLLKGKIRRSYRYHARLLLWHMKRCPDGGGLKKIKT